MININKLKAGDCITRLKNPSSSFTVGREYIVNILFDDLYIIDDEDEDNLVSFLNINNWEQVIEHEEMSPEESFDRDLKEACENNLNEVLHHCNNVKHVSMLHNYLKQHNIIANFNSNTQLFQCEALYYDCVKGESFTEMEEVEPNMKAVREWLGY